MGNNSNVIHRYKMNIGFGVRSRDGVKANCTVVHFEEN